MTHPEVRAISPETGRTKAVSLRVLAQALWVSTCVIAGSLAQFLIHPPGV
jgi:hypothetical protein